MAGNKLLVGDEVEDYTEWGGPRFFSKAIKEFCKECMGGVASEVRHCSSTLCPLKPFRTGKNPFLVERVYTDVQRIEMKERLLKNRGNKDD